MLNYLEKVSLNELTSNLGFKDYRTTIKWLNSHNIPFKKQGNEYVIYKWHIELVEAIDLAKDLQVRFPSNWFKLIETMIPDTRIVKAVFELMPPRSSRKTSDNNNDTFKFFS